MLSFSIQKKIFQFKTPSGTSRGILTEKKSWFIELYDKTNDNVKGIGECSIIPGLSPDYFNDEEYEKLIVRFLELFSTSFTSQSELETISLIPTIKKYPSILFGIETAFLDLTNGGKAAFFNTNFTQGIESIPINGLIWMGNEGFMKEQVKLKLNEGFTCLKMKIGAIDFEKELTILSSIRKQFSSDELILRVDANGAFNENEIDEKFKMLEKLEIHSIEQPIKAGQWEEMRKICSTTKIPVALDEELIGITETEEKINLLETIKPQYIILKPSLHGGIFGTTEWIQLAEERKIPWWITSALESNIGLNCIAQFTSQYKNLSHQGLGTGSLYVSNFPTNLFIEKGKMYYKTDGNRFA